jgi:hypothetical protein
VDFFQIKQSDFRREPPFTNYFMLTLALFHYALSLVQQENTLCLLSSAMPSCTSSTYAVNGSVTEYVFYACGILSPASIHLSCFSNTTDQEPQLHSECSSLQSRTCGSWLSVDIYFALCVYGQTRIIQAEGVIMAQRHLGTPKALPLQICVGKH